MPPCWSALTSMASIWHGFTARLSSSLQCFREPIPSYRRRSTSPPTRGISPPRVSAAVPGPRWRREAPPNLPRLPQLISSLYFNAYSDVHIDFRVAPGCLFGCIRLVVFVQWQRRLLIVCLAPLLRDQLRFVRTRCCMAGDLQPEHRGPSGKRGGRARASIVRAAGNLFSWH